MNWILDEDRGCITDNAEPILEASFNDVKSKKALKLASKAPEMLEMLKDILHANRQGTFEYVNFNDIEELIKSATTI